MNIISRKKHLEQLVKQAKNDEIVKQATEELDINAYDAETYADKLIDKLLESINIEGLDN